MKNRTKIAPPRATPGKKQGDMVLKQILLQIKIGKIAVMGCVVNGPGEAKDADLGIAGSKNGLAAVFKKGKLKGVFPENEALKIFREELCKSNAV